MSSKDQIKAASGGNAGGAAPPAGAPIEHAQPLQQGEIDRQLAMAAQNEQVLAPFAPAAGEPILLPPPQLHPGTLAKMPRRAAPRGGVTGTGTGTGAVASRAPGSSGIVLTDVPNGAGSSAVAVDTSVSPGNADETGPIPLVAGRPGGQPDTQPVIPTLEGTDHDPRLDRDQPGAPADDPAAAPPRSPLAAAARQVMGTRPAIVDGERYQPAASNSDSPSRGLPSSSLDPGKQITGGFGQPTTGMYFPLDGSELRALVFKLMDELADQISSDLRFSMALTYPRVAARVVVEVSAYPDGSFEIPKVMIPVDRLPEEIARRLHDHVCFCVIAERTEMAADGGSLNPPDKVRDDLQLSKPQKQIVDTPGGRMIVDRKAEMRALTGGGR